MDELLPRAGLYVPVVAFPVSTRCEYGAHGDCMQGAWCMCGCHEMRTGA